MDKKIGEEIGEKITVVRNKKALLSEYEQLNRMMHEYATFLGEQETSTLVQKNANQVLRSQQLALQQARASLRTVDLVCALIRQVVSGLTVERFSFKSLPDIRVEEVSGGAEEGTSPEQMVAWVNSALRNAPLEAQEKVRGVLRSVLSFFEELSQENVRGVENALTQMNILTSNPKTQSMVREIAVITRDIFTSLRNVSEGLPLDSLTESSGGISDAVKKLHSVMKRLEDAADENLDSLEKVNQLAGSKESHMEGVIDSLHNAQGLLTGLKEAHPDMAERLGKIQDRLSDEVGAPLMELQMTRQNYMDNHMELISNQSFQELSTRTLNKIILFVETMEREMLELMKEFRPALDLEASQTTPRPAPSDLLKSEAKGTEMESAESAKNSEIKQSQEEVDKLLGELGF